MTRPDWPALMGTPLAAAYLDTSEHEIRRLAADGELPQVRKRAGAHPKYARVDLDAYVERLRKAR